MRIYPLTDLIILPLSLSIAVGITDQLSLSTQKIYISLRSKHDKFVTNLPTNISIRRVATGANLYTSQLAHQLSQSLKLTPSEVCQQLELKIDSQDLILSHGIVLHYWCNDAGYIYCQAKSIDSWLNYIENVPLESINPQIQPQTGLDIARYAHARCCSLLRLASTEKLISLNDLWQITTPNWLIHEVDLVANSPTIDRTSIFQLPIEQSLIHALMDVLDAISSKKSHNFQKLAINLAHNWLEFDRHTQTFGDTKRQNPPLAIARCGLTAISRRYLQILLENYLNISPPAEL